MTTVLAIVTGGCVGFIVGVIVALRHVAKDLVRARMVRMVDMGLKPFGKDVDP